MRHSTYFLTLMASQKHVKFKRSKSVLHYCSPHLLIVCFFFIFLLFLYLANPLLHIVHQRQGVSFPNGHSRGYPRPISLILVQKISIISVIFIKISVGIEGLKLKLVD